MADAADPHLTFVADGVSDAVFSPDGSLVYVATADGFIRQFDSTTLVELSSWDIGVPLTGLAISPDGRHLAAAEGSADFKPIVAYDLDVRSGALTTTALDGFRFGDLTFLSRDVLMAATYADDFSAIDLQTAAIWGGTMGIGVNTLKLTRDQNLVLQAEMATTGGLLRLVDTRSLELVAWRDSFVLDGALQNTSLAFKGYEALSSRAEAVLQVAGHGVVNVFDLELSFTRTIDLGSDVAGMAFDPGGDFAYFYLPEPGELVVLDARSWAEVERLDVGGAGLWGATSYGATLSFDRSGEHLLLLGHPRTGTLRAIDLSSGGERFVGSGGADAFVGGRGGDLYRVNNAGDTIVEQAAQGRDVVRSSVDWTLPDNVERLVLTGAAVAGSGNSRSNEIKGNLEANRLEGLEGADVLRGGAGDDALTGGEGRDTLIGGAGADLMEGGAGDDVYVVDGVDDRLIERSGEGRDTVRSASSYSLTKNVEDLTLTGRGDADGVGSRAANFMVGNSGANNLEGKDGADTLLGGAGADTLDGGRGNDRLEGGAGADRLLGGQGDDVYIVTDERVRIWERDGEGRDRIEANVDVVMAPGVEDLTLYGTGPMDGVGNDLDNVIIGNRGSTRLTGAGGADHLTGWGAGDTFVYLAVEDSPVTGFDTVTDFGTGDRLDLSAIDANGEADGDGAFVLVASDAQFTEAGQMRFSWTSGGTAVELNVDGDADAEGLILLEGIYLRAGSEAGWAL